MQQHFTASSHPCCIKADYSHLSPQIVSLCSRVYHWVSSNIYEDVRAVLTFFYERFCTHQKAQKKKQTQKAQKRNPKKAQNASEQTKIKNVLKKHLRGKK